MLARGNGAVFWSNIMYPNIHKYLLRANAEFPGDVLQLKVQYVYDETGDGPEGLATIACICDYEGDYSSPHHHEDNVWLTFEADGENALHEALSGLDAILAPLVQAAEASNV